MPRSGAARRSAVMNRTRTDDASIEQRLREIINPAFEEWLIQKIDSTELERRRELAQKQAIAEFSGGSTAGADATAAASTPTALTVATATAAPAVSAEQEVSRTALSKQVRNMRKGGAHEGLQRNVSNGFDAVMRRLEAVYAASKGDAPTGFEELINYWHSACGLSDAARKDLHVMRIWRNASDHHDSDRWRRDGPRSDEEALVVLERIEAAIDALEG